MARLFLFSLLIVSIFVWDDFAVAQNRSSGESSIQGAQLQITSKEECEILGGTWNACPPNECQESDGYKNGEITCPAVCGNPRCEGIVPEEDGDLSEIHNPTVYEERVTPNGAVTSLYDIPSNKNNGIASSVYQKINNFLDDGDSARALFVILGLFILYMYFLIKHKKRKRK